MSERRERRKLDRTRKFGTITPPYMGAGFDRRAHFEQDGAFFDAHDREIIPGQPLTEDEIAETVSAPATAHQGTRRMTPAALLAKVDMLPWPQFKAAAKELLGDSCPKSKGQIKATLEVMARGGKITVVEADPRIGVSVDGGSAPARRRQTEEAGVEGAGEQAVQPVAAPKPAKAAVPAAAKAAAAQKAKAAAAAVKAANGNGNGPGVGVDLAAWGRGKGQYLFSEVKQAAEVQLGLKGATDRRQILNAVIAAGLVEAEHARKDI